MPTKDRPGEAPRLKAAWKQMYSNEAVRIRKESEGVAAQDFDEPLPAHVHRDMMGIAVAHYRWQRYSTYSILCDGQVGRLRRECQAYQPTTFKVAKGRIQALMPAVAGAKRKHLAEDLTMLVGPEEVEDSMANDLWNWCEKLLALGNTLGIVGCFDVDVIESGSSTPVKVRYIHWCEATLWVESFTRRVPKLRRKFIDSSILEYLEECQESFMNKAVEVARGPNKPPYGRALVALLISESVIWTH
jgi:hypothetical protein